MSVHLKILQAVSSVRVGDGGSTSAIDLPLARERHTRWPFIPGSSLKGALRIRAELRCDKDLVAAVFGGPPGEQSDPDGSSPKGSLVVGGATLLALPVRSLDHTFALLSCPTALARFGRVAGDAPPLPEPPVGEAWVGDARRVSTTGQANLGGSKRGVLDLEDLDLVGVPNPDVAAWAARIAQITGDDAPLSHLTLVHDDVFAHACLAWTEHRTRNAIGEDGVVQDKKLFTVESLPGETLWWLTLSTEEGDGDSDGDANKNPALLPEDGEVFVLGGHQSVGMGRVAWYGDTQ